MATDFVGKSMQNLHISTVNRNVAGYINRSFNGFFDIITEKLGLFKCYFTSSFTTTVQLAKIF